MVRCKIFSRLQFRGVWTSIRRVKSSFASKKNSGPIQLSAFGDRLSHNILRFRFFSAVDPRRKLPAGHDQPAPRFRSLALGNDQTTRHYSCGFCFNAFITPDRCKIAPKMNSRPLAKQLFSLAAILLATSGVACAQDIYKCTKAGQAVYTDRPCVGGKGELLHQADDTEIIDQYLDLGQDDAAKRYAVSHNIASLYKQRIEARKQRMEAKAQQQAEQDAADRLQEQADRRQAQIDAATARGRLQGENDALRQQNALYQQQLTQPVYNDAGPYYNAGPGYWGGIPPHDGDQPGDKPPRPPAPPTFHPCVPVAGGTVKC